jgi:hypothetical protein
VKSLIIEEAQALNIKERCLLFVTIFTEARSKLRPDWFRIQYVIQAIQGLKVSKALKGDLWRGDIKIRPV